MKRSNLKNKFHKNHSVINKNNYTKARNYCATLREESNAEETFAIFANSGSFANV